MWYFTWILGVGVAMGFGVINAMWLESRPDFISDHGVEGRSNLPA